MLTLQTPTLVPVSIGVQDCSFCHTNSRLRYPGPAGEGYRKHVPRSLQQAQPLYLVSLVLPTKCDSI